MKRLAWFGFFAMQIILLGGCATPALWEEGRFVRYHEPASSLGLRLFHSSQRQDVLVEYVESREDNGSTKRRAFWLDYNIERLEMRRKPRFVSAKEVEELTPIPIIDAALVAGIKPVNTGLYAVVSTNGHAFTLYSAGAMFYTCELPVYRDASGRVKQVLLTPAAVAADLTIVGGVLAVIYAPELWPMLNCLAH